MTALALIASPIASPSERDQEAHAHLTTELSGRTGRVPADRVATHILNVTRGGDWPLRKAAFEALHRRIKAASESSESRKLEGIASLLKQLPAPR